MIEQNSPAWHDIRRGRITASLFDRVMRAKRETWPTIADDINHGTGFYGNIATKWGKRYEPEALARFELETGIDTVSAGFCHHPTDDRIGCSPDFLVDPFGDLAGGEIKCPFNPKNHAAVLFDQAIPEKHIAQVQGSIWINQSDYWYFISYDPREAPENQIVFFRVYRDDRYIKKLSKKITDFADYLRTGEIAVADGIPNLF